MRGVKSCHYSISIRCAHNLHWWEVGPAKVISFTKPIELVFPCFKLIFLFFLPSNSWRPNSSGPNSFSWTTLTLPSLLLMSVVTDVTEMPLGIMELNDVLNYWSAIDVTIVKLFSSTPLLSLNHLPLSSPVSLLVTALSHSPHSLRNSSSWLKYRRVLYI
jgi:hypothetical protein